MLKFPPYRIINKPKVAKTVFVFVAFLVFLTPVSVAFAAPLSNADSKSILDDTVWYEPSGAATTEDCGQATPITVPGASSPTLPSNVPEPYNSLFTRASAKYKINPQFLAAIFLTENGNIWKPFNTAWASSPAGASGPFQFMPATWAAYQTDGNGDGVADINNMYDAAYAAASMLSHYSGVNTPLGTLTTPFAHPTLLEAAAAYNWGPGNVQQAGASAPITVAPQETQEYVSNVYSLITSGFTKSGKPAYPDPVGTISGSGTGTNPTPPSDTNTACASGGAVAGDAVQTAIAYAWPDYHPPVYVNEKDIYKQAILKARANGEYTGGDYDAQHVGIDCGGFITRVMRDSGVDPNYNAYNGDTVQQQKYMDDHPNLYLKLSGVTGTANLKPGDIAINSDHTYMYVGNNPGFNGDSASASFSTSGLSWRAPMASNAYNFTSFSWYRKI